MPEEEEEDLHALRLAALKTKRDDGVPKVSTLCCLRKAVGMIIWCNELMINSINRMEWLNICTCYVHCSYRA